MFTRYLCYKGACKLSSPVLREHAVFCMEQFLNLHLCLLHVCIQFWFLHCFWIMMYTYTTKFLDLQVLSWAPGRKKNQNKQQLILTSNSFVPLFFTSCLTSETLIVLKTECALYGHQVPPSITDHLWLFLNTINLLGRVW